MRLPRLVSELDEPHARSNRSYNPIDGNEAETLQCGCARGENETGNQTGCKGKRYYQAEKNAALLPCAT